MEKSKNLSLEQRFIKFFKSRVEVQDIDEIEILKTTKGIKKADFIVNGNIIVELKTLKKDPQGKVKNVLSQYEKEAEYPLFLWNAPISEILKDFPNKEAINREIFFEITKSIKRSFEKADSQIRDSKLFLNKRSATGALVLLNENINLFEPKIIVYIAQCMMKRKNKTQNLLYPNINFVYLICESHFIKINDKLVTTPLILIEGPLSDQHQEAINHFEIYNLEWAQFNNMPLMNLEGSPIKFLENKFESFQKESEPPEAQKALHKSWRQWYKQNPYLNNLDNEDLFIYGQKILENLAPNFLKGLPKQSNEEIMKLMNIWTHFLEEAEKRNLNLKNLNSTIVERLRTLD